MKSRLFLTGLSAVVLLTACVKTDSMTQPTSFEIEPLDACVTIVVDMSGSFAESWDDRAYRLFLNISDRFFTDSMGGNSRLVLAQMSLNKEFLLWEGHPSELRSSFPNPDAFNTFLKQRSNPEGSPVYEATREAVRYSQSLAGLQPSTRLLTVMLSDMVDNFGNADEQRTAGYRMLDALKAYQQLGGGLALYYVDLKEVPRWQRILEMAGFKPGQFVIQSSLVENPILPRFD